MGEMTSMCVLDKNLQFFNGFSIPRGDVGVVKKWIDSLRYGKYSPWYLYFCLSILFFTNVILSTLELGRRFNLFLRSWSISFVVSSITDISSGDWHVSSKSDVQLTKNYIVRPRCCKGMKFIITRSTRENGIGWLRSSRDTYFSGSQELEPRQQRFHKALPGFPPFQKCKESEMMKTPDIWSTVFENILVSDFFGFTKIGWTWTTTLST